MSWFDRFASTASGVAARAPYFLFCVVLVAAWAAQGVALALGGRGWGYFTNPAYQLEINSTTTILTFWVAALIQNSTARSDKATQRKLDALADGVADLLDVAPDGVGKDHAHELRRAVGIEERVSA